MANARSPVEDEALIAAREAATLRPGIASLALVHGQALSSAGRLPEAIGEFQRALRLDHEFADARLALGSAWLCAGEPEKALEAFARLDESAPGIAEKMDAAKAMLARPRCDAGYVRHLFDQFASDYDARMIAQLSYRAPQILRELFDLVAPGRTGLDILDLGCGTGLTGVAFQHVAQRLDGIDLSPAMIDKARARQIYDSLAVADIDSALAERRGGYDLLLAADTLVYLGDLASVLIGAEGCLRQGGMFLITVERKDGEDFELGPKRRWRHSEPYLRQAATDAGFDVAGIMTCTPRKEANCPVEGFAIALSLNP